MHQAGGGARLVEFSFTSTLAAGVDDEALMRLARQAWTANARAGVTGLLRIDGRTVDQVIEGPASAILPLGARILNDSRHGAIRVRVFAATPARRFAAWTTEGIAAPRLAETGVPAAALAGARVLRLLPASSPAATAWRPPAPLAALREA